MKVTKTAFQGLLIIEPKVFTDSRGYFFESYNKKVLREAGIDIEFVQDNQSRSQKGTLRGLHFQKPPHAQTKLVAVLDGAIQDVVVDLRKGQPTYGKHLSIDLTSENKTQLLVPKGFAHGFLVLSERADVLYKCDDYYHPETEAGILYNDSTLGIDWKTDKAGIILSNKDEQNPGWARIDVVF